MLLRRGAIAYDTWCWRPARGTAISAETIGRGIAPGLKTIDDGTAIRRRLLLAFEEAESAESRAEREAWLTFAIVGGGPTGVELAGAIAELARHGMTMEFRAHRPGARPRRC